MIRQVTALLTAALVAVGVLLVRIPVDSSAAGVVPDDGKSGEEVAELKKRVAKLEAEVAELRKTQAGLINPATELKTLSELAKVRSAELLQRTQNTHATLREVMKNQNAGPALQTKINDLNNELTALWLAMAGYGLGKDPYLDDIQLSNSGFSRAKLPSDHGIAGPYVRIGLPRLHDRYLELAGIKGKEADTQSAEFKKLVSAYSNPAVFTHRAFNERAYSEYRNGDELFTPQYKADLKALDQWLTDLEAVLGKVPDSFVAKP